MGEVGGRRALARVGVENRRVQLPRLLGELEQQVVRGLDRLGGLGVGAVDLVDDDDRLQAECERLAEHDPRLRHRPLGGVDQQQAAVRHPEHPLDLAAEVRVARGVDDVELDPVVANRRGLGEDRDPLLALEIVRIHDQLAHLLVGREDARLLQQRVDERGLAVVDVRDDRDVAEVCPALFAGHERRWHLSILTARRSSSARDPFQELLNVGREGAFELLEHRVLAPRGRRGVGVQLLEQPRQRRGQTPERSGVGGRRRTREREGRPSPRRRRRDRRRRPADVATGRWSLRAGMDGEGHHADRRGHTDEHAETVNTKHGLPPKIQL